MTKKAKRYILLDADDVCMSAEDVIQQLENEDPAIAAKELVENLEHAWFDGPFTFEQKLAIGQHVDVFHFFHAIQSESFRFALTLPRDTDIHDVALMVAEHLRTRVTRPVRSITSISRRTVPADTDFFEGTIQTFLNWIYWASLDSKKMPSFNKIWEFLEPILLEQIEEYTREDFRMHDEEWPIFLRDSGFSQFANYVAFGERPHA